MFRGKRLVLVVAGLVVVLGAAAYGLTRQRHSANPGPYAAVIERLHEINHEMRQIQHSYKPRLADEEAFERWHDLLHEEKDLLHGLPGAVEGAALEGTREHDLPEHDRP